MMSERSKSNSTVTLLSGVGSGTTKRILLCMPKTFIVFTLDFHLDRIGKEREKI